MNISFEGINSIFGFIGPLSDWIWDFPSNYEWWSRIPILGSFSLAVILLLGTGIYLTIRTGFIQLTHFKAGIRAIARKKSAEKGISPAAAFFLSTAMRVGPGNIIGVTGAITTGGPGALFWMWVSAFFGMATAFAESTLAQIFKKPDGDLFVGGLPFYGRKLVKNSALVGGFLSVLYILYALCCFPAQGFNTLSAVGEVAEAVTGETVASNSPLLWIAGGLILALTAYVAFGGIKQVTRVTDKLTPIMAVVYCLTVLLLIVTNLSRVPFFFTAVFSGAFAPEAIFGGVFGIALQQGIKRGLMSNEAGQGTITMPAAAADAEHPCQQGCVQAVGVFLDTIVICTLTGFVVVMGRMWTGEGSAAWLELDRLPKFLTSVTELSGGPVVGAVTNLLVTICFGLFAYTCLIGFITFSEISVARITTKKSGVTVVRFLCLGVIAFGMVCSLGGYNLDNLWAFSDLGNILIVYANIPLIYIGMKYVLKATRHFKANGGKGFTEKVVGLELDYWKDEDSADENVQSKDPAAK